MPVLLFLLSVLSLSDARPKGGDRKPWMRPAPTALEVAAKIAADSQNLTGMHTVLLHFNFNEG